MLSAVSTTSASPCQRAFKTVKRFKTFSTTNDG
ncbi:hypothetical protein DJ87_5722 [Bacillus cereus]|nr:hypothetical protein DJ87_5722 [Bacillus cereus]